MRLAHLDGPDVLLAEPLERLDDLLVRAAQLRTDDTLCREYECLY